VRGARQGHPTRLTGSLTSLFVLSLLVLPTGSALATEREADPLSLGAIPERPAAGAVRDRVIDGQPPAYATASARVVSGEYRTPDGHTVEVQVSAAYADPEVRAQELVNFLGSLLHADEMSQLSASLLAPRQLRRACGGGALACYFPDAGEIAVSAVEGGFLEPPREFVIAHEYGHHVAANRSNKPWTALARGTKRWSTHERICGAIKQHKIRPSFYFENPGEAFAESFAFYHYPDTIDWIWDIARPDAGSYDAIRNDVLSPWARRTSSSSAGTLSREDRRHVIRLDTPLDGRLEVRLDGPPGADFDLELLRPNQDRVLKRAAHPGPDETLRYTVCGNREVRVVVHRIKGAGPFELTTARP
jgi:hypothetical protein